MEWKLIVFVLSCLHLRLIKLYPLSDKLVRSFPNCAPRLLFDRPPPHSFPAIFIYLTASQGLHEPALKCPTPALPGDSELTSPADAMANAFTSKSKPGPGASLKITPSNSPILRPGSRSPCKSSHQSSLSLQTVLGTTTATPNGFSSHDQSKSFALCAGSAAVLAELDNDANVTQRFFRARPSATSMNPTTSFYNQSTPPTTPDARPRSIHHIRSNPHLNVSNASPSSEAPESASPRALSSRERIKAVTSVSISPNGRLLAVGEVSLAQSKSF